MILREVRALRSSYELVQSESHADTVLAVVTLAVVVGPWVMERIDSSGGRQNGEVTKR